jgi:hypothetical protein
MSALDAKPVHSDPEVHDGDDRLVECAGCGVKGLWKAPGHVINYGNGGPIDGFCSFKTRPTQRLRAHGPWVPRSPE